MKAKILLVVLALQTAWILGMTFTQEGVLRHGKTVLLETGPGAPRDLLRGEYLVLNYKISDVSLALFSPALTNAPEPGRPVYVVLKSNGAFHEVAQASMKPFSPAEGQVLLKGQSARWWNHNTTNSVHVAYGLERYYVREQTGNPRGKITVRAAVSASGHGLIRQVWLDGKPYAEAMMGEAHRPGGGVKRD
jgi:uncharacterized membrane-anchored protein